MEISVGTLLYVLAIAVHGVVGPALRKPLELLAVGAVLGFLVFGYLYVLVVSRVASMGKHGPVS